MIALARGGDDDGRQSKACCMQSFRPALGEHLASTSGISRVSVSSRTGQSARQAGMGVDVCRHSSLISFLVPNSKREAKVTDIRSNAFLL